MYGNRNQGAPENEGPTNEPTLLPGVFPGLPVSCQRFGLPQQEQLIHFRRQSRSEQGREGPRGSEFGAVHLGKEMKFEKILRNIESGRKDVG